MKFIDLVGEYKTNPQEAINMLNTLFFDEDIISLSGKRTTIGPNKLLTNLLKKKELVSILDEDILNNLCFDSGNRDIYVGLGPVKPEVSIRESFSPFKRVKKEDISAIRVLFIDIDIKDGGFSSTRDAWIWLWEICNKYQIPPTYITNSGSGGMHVYWRVSREPLITKPGSDEINPDTEGKDLLQGWWAFLSEELPEGINIDRLVDTTRMSRLAGTIHFPREDGGKVGVVKELFCCPSNILKFSDITELTKEANSRHKKKVENTRKREIEIKYPPEVKNNFFMRLLHIANQASSAEDIVTKQLSWDDILTPKGWQFLREDGEGRREWARPGRNSKSAVTDWSESPYVMSLMSTSPETELHDLLEAYVPLTKWRVYVRLYFNDDYQAAIIYLTENNGR